MYFLNPAAFWALTLLLIPILIHLFNLRKVKKVYFSNTLFLKEIDQKQKSKSSLRKLIILLCRCLVFLFIVFAFAQPELSTEDELEHRGMTLYVDNSFSMIQRSEQGESLLDLSKSATINELTGNVGIDYILYTNTGKVKNDFIAGIGPANAKVSSGLLRLEASGYGSRIKIFSDFQKSDLNDLSWLKRDTISQVSLLKLAYRPGPNLFVDTVFLSKPLGVLQDNVIHVEVRNGGNELVNGKLIKVLKQGQQLASFTVDVPAGKSVPLELNVASNEQIYGSYEILLEDAPVVFDNHFYFEIAERANVVVREISQDGVRSYFERVYANENLFDYQRFSIENVSSDIFLEADLIILNTLDSIPEWLLNQLQRFNKNVLVVPSAKATLSTYSQVLGVQVSRVEAMKTSLSTETLNLPFFEGVFRNANDRVGMPEVTPRYGVKGFHETLLQTNAGAPFLIKSGKRDSYFITGTLEDSLTNFHKHSVFVPVMYKLTQADHQMNLYHRLSDGFITIKADSLPTESLVELRGEEVLVPSYRYSGQDLMMEIPEALNKPGYYNVVVGKDTVNRIALNYDKGESLLASYSLAELEEAFAGYPNIEVKSLDSEKVLSTLQGDVNERPAFWKYALVLALIFVILETILLRFAP